LREADPMIVTIDLNFYLHLAQVAIGVVTIFFGRRLYWLWIGFIAFLLGERIVSFALFRSTDLVRFSLAAAVGLLFALLAVRLRRHVLTLGGFLSAGALGIVVMGRFVPVAPRLLALTVLLGAGLAGAIFVWRNHDLGTIILSAVSGTLAGMAIVRVLVGSNQVVEAVSFVIIAGLGIWFQVRQWRRELVPAEAEGAGDVAPNI